MMMLHHIYLNCELKQFLKLKKVIVLPYLSYSKYLDLYDLFSFFPSLKRFFLSGRHYKSTKALASAISQCLNGLSKSAYRDAFHNLIRKIMHLNPRRILKGNAMCIPLSDLNASEKS